MENYADIFKTEQKYGYSVNSGTVAVVDPNLEMVLNEFGLYEPALIDPTVEHSEFNDDLSNVSAMSDSSADETEIARDLFASVPEIKHDPVLGYYLGLYAGYVVEGQYREHGSSGGLTTWLLVQLLEKGHIDGVIHLKEADDGDGVLFKYAISRSAEEIRDGAKSRYYPGEVSRAIRAAQEQGGVFAITGIPSFITEIQLLKRLSPVYSQMFPYTFGLICGHQKSTKYAEAMAWEYGIEPGNLMGIDFRKKNPNTPASKYMTEMRGLMDGKPTTIIKSQHEFIVTNWSHGFFKPKLSDYTDDAFNETADVAFGDAWLPQYVADSGGTNVLITRNPLIEEIVSEGARNGLVHLEPLSPEMTLRSQRGLVHHTQDEIGYRLHKTDSKGDWRPQKRFPASNDLPFIRKQVQDVRSEIANQSHIAFQEAVERGNWNHFAETMGPKVKRHSRLYKLMLLRRNSPFKTFQKAIRLMIRKVRAR